MQDASDRQYYNYINNLAPLTIYFTVVIVGRKIWELLFNLTALKRKVEGDLQSNTAKRVTFLYSAYYSLHGVAFVVFLHGGTSLYYFISIIILFLISKLNGSKYNPVSINYYLIL